MEQTSFTTQHIFFPLEILQTGYFLRANCLFLMMPKAEGILLFKVSSKMCKYFM